MHSNRAAKEIKGKLALSLIGYVLFFTLRFRLKTSLILTFVSLGLLATVVVWLAP